MNHKGMAGDSMSADIRSNRGLGGCVAVVGYWTFEAYRTHPDGTRKKLWREETKNLVVNQGLNGLLGSTLGAWTQVTSWFIGVTSGHPTVSAADTGSSHAGWDEFTGYTATERVGYTPAAVSGQSVDNSAAKASFSLNAAGSIGGGFLISVNSKAIDGGSLYAVGSFALKTLSSGDTLEVQATFTTAAA